jgi:hypothetical protein
LIAKRLKRSERSVHDWLHGKRKVPWWVPEILRLQHFEYYDRLRQMGFTPPRRRLAVATADVLAFPKPVAAIVPETGTTIISNPESIRTSAR